MWAIVASMCWIILWYLVLRYGRGLVMKRLLRQSEWRQLELVEYLTEKNTWVTNKEISEKLHTSERSIKKDIAHLRKTQTDFILTSSYQGIRIEYGLNSSIENYYQYVLKQSHIFKALELIFFNPTITPEDLQEELFVSQSTYYRHIKSSNVVLEDNFKISIDPNTAEITGNEEDIRRFYWAYFAERYNMTVWPFSNLIEEAFDQFLLGVIEIGNVEVEYSNLAYLKKVIAVNLIRFREGNFIDLKVEDTHLMRFWNLLPEPTSEVQYVMGLLNIEFSHEMAIQVFGQFIQKTGSLTLEHFEELLGTFDVIPEQIAFYSQLLDKLSKKFDIPLKNKGQLVWFINNNVYNEGFIQHSVYIYYNPDREIIELLKKYNPEFISDLTQGIKEYRQLIDKPLTKFTIDNLVYQTCVRWPDLIINLYNQWITIEALFVSNLSNGRTKLITDVIDNDFGNRINIQMFDGNDITEINNESLKRRNLDLVISTFPIPNINAVPVIVWSGTTSIQDSLSLYEFITEISEKKENLFN